MAEAKNGGDAPVTIKKYANRRLYNTATSSYVTLDHLAGMVRDGIDFAVFDAKTGDDITRSVLTQIIVEEEAKGQNLLPISFLRQLISLYGDNLQWLVPRYLEQSMAAFSENQERMRTQLRETLGGLFPFGQFDEMSKQNAAMFERAMRMFTPFGPGDDQAGPSGEAGGGEAPKGQPKSPASPDQVAALQNQLDELRSQLETLKTTEKKK